MVRFYRFFVAKFDFSINNGFYNYIKILPDSKNKLISFAHLWKIIIKHNIIYRCLYYRLVSINCQHTDVLFSVLYD